MSEEDTATITMAAGFKTINNLLTDAKASVDDTYLYGTLLSAKKSFGVRIYNKMSPYNSSKKGRYDTDAKYDRYLLFRETCSGKGSCFVIMFLLEPKTCPISIFLTNSSVYHILFSLSFSWL